MGNIQKKGKVLTGWTFVENKTTISSPIATPQQTHGLCLEIGAEMRHDKFNSQPDPCYIIMCWGLCWALVS